MKDITKEIKKLEDIVSIGQWKDEHKQNVQIESINKYLKILSFNELINEANDMITQLNSSKLEPLLILNSKLILNELHHRLGIKKAHAFA